MADYPYATLDRRITLFLTCFLALYTLDIAVAHILSNPPSVQAVADILLPSRLRDNFLLNILIRCLFRSIALLGLVLQPRVRRIIVLIPYVLAISSILQRYQLSLVRRDDAPSTQRKILEDSGRQTYTARKALEMNLEDHDIEGFPDIYPTAHPADSAQNRMLQRFQRRISIGPSPLAVSKTPEDEETERPLREDPSSTLRVSTSVPVSDSNLGVPAMSKEDESGLSDLSGDETPKTPRPSQEAFKHLVGTLNSMFRSVLAPEYISPRRDNQTSDSDEEPDYSEPRATKITSENLKAAVREAYPGNEVDVSQLSRAVRQALPNIEYCRRLKVLYQQKKHEADDLLRKNETLTRWMSETRKQNRRIHEELGLARQRLADAGITLPQIDTAQFQNDTEESIKDSLTRVENIQAGSPVAFSPSKEVYEERLSYAEAKNQSQMKIIQKQGSRIHDLTVGIDLLQEDNRRLRKLREDLYDEITELEDQNEDLKKELQSRTSDSSTKEKGDIEEVEKSKEEELETVSNANRSSDHKDVSAQRDEHVETPTVDAGLEEHNSPLEGGTNTCSSDLQARYDNEKQHWTELVKNLEEDLKKRTRERDLQAAYSAELEQKLQEAGKAQNSSKASTTVDAQDGKLETELNTSRDRDSERSLAKTHQDALAELETCRERCHSLETELEVSQKTAKQLKARASAEVTAMKEWHTAKTPDNERLLPQEAQYSSSQDVLLPELNMITSRQDIDADKLNEAAADLTTLREENRTLIETVIKKDERIADLEDEISSLAAAPEREPPSPIEADIETTDLKAQLRKLQSMYDNYRNTTGRIIADCKKHEAEVARLKKASKAHSGSESSAPRKTIYVFTDPQTGEKLRTTEPNSEIAKEFRRDIETGRMFTQFLQEEYNRQRDVQNEMVAEMAAMRDFQERLKDRHMGRLIQYQRLIERYNQLYNAVRLRLMPLLDRYKAYYDMREAADREMEGGQVSRDTEGFGDGQESRDAINDEEG